MRKPWSGFSGCEAEKKAAKPRWRAAILIGLVCASSAMADDSRLFELRRTDAGNSPLLIGDRLALELREQNDSEFVIRPPAGEQLAALTEAGWEILPGDSPKAFYAVPLKPGTVTLPSLPVYPAQTDSAQAAGFTVPMTFQVTSSIAQDDPKAQEPAPLRPPTAVSLPLWVTIAAILAALVVLGILTWLLIRLSRKSRVTETPAKTPKPPLPEDVAALEALNAVAAADWISKGAFKAHYFGISEILKTYFGARYRFDARESTTAELLRALEDRAAAGDSVLDRVEKIFEKLDLVKFTDHVPHSAEGAGLLEEARSLVRLTRRPPVQITQGGGGN